MTLTSPGLVGRYVDLVIDGIAPSVVATFLIPRSDRPTITWNMIVPTTGADDADNTSLGSAENTVVQESGQFGICLPCLEGAHDRCHKPCSCRSKWHIEPRSDEGEPSASGSRE